MCSMSGESETNAHDRREVGVTTLPMTDVSSAFWAHRLILARRSHSETTPLCSGCFSNSVGRKDESCKA